MGPFCLISLGFMHKKDLLMSDQLRFEAKLCHFCSLHHFQVDGITSSGSQRMVVPKTGPGAKKLENYLAHYFEVMTTWF